MFRTVHVRLSLRPLRIVYPCDNMRCPAKMAQLCWTHQCLKAVTNTNTSAISHLPAVPLLVSSMLPDTWHVPAVPSRWDHPNAQPHSQVANMSLSGPRRDSFRKKVVFVEGALL
jgi:hypothetical protein